MQIGATVNSGQRPRAATLTWNSVKNNLDSGTGNII